MEGSYLQGFTVSHILVLLQSHVQNSDFERQDRFLCTTFQVRGDETQVLQSVLECDTEREKLLQEEKRLLTLTGHGRYDQKRNGHYEEVQFHANDTCRCPASCQLCTSFSRQLTSLRPLLLTNKII